MGRDRRNVAKLRVHELAKELGVESKTVLAKLNELGEFVKSASSTVEAPVVRKLREAIPAQQPAEEKKASKPKAPAKKAPTPKPKAEEAPAPEAPAEQPPAPAPKAPEQQPAAQATRPTPPPPAPKPAPTPGPKGPEEPR